MQSTLWQGVRHWGRKCIELDRLLKIGDHYSWLFSAISKVIHWKVSRLPQSNLFFQKIVVRFFSNCNRSSSSSVFSALQNLNHLVRIRTLTAPNRTRLRPRRCLTWGRRRCAWRWWASSSSSRRTSMASPRSSSSRQSTWWVTSIWPQRPLLASWLTYISDLKNSYPFCFDASVSDVMNTTFFRQFGQRSMDFCG